MGHRGYGENMMKLLLLLLTLNAFAYQQFGSSGSLMSPMTTAQRDLLNPLTGGVMIYNTTTQSYQVWTGTIWATIGGAGASGDVTGPALSVIDELVLFSDTTGKVIKRNPALRISIEGVEYSSDILSNYKIRAGHTTNGSFAELAGQTAGARVEANYPGSGTSFLDSNPTNSSLFLNRLTGTGNTDITMGKNGVFFRLQTPTAFTENITLKLPVRAPLNDEILKSDSVGQLSWVALPTGGGAGSGSTIDEWQTGQAYTVGQLLNGGTDKNWILKVAVNHTSGDIDLDLNSGNLIALSPPLITTGLQDGGDATLAGTDITVQAGAGYIVTYANSVSPYPLIKSVEWGLQTITMPATGVHTLFIDTNGVLTSTPGLSTAQMAQDNISVGLVDMDLGQVYDRETYPTNPVGQLKELALFLGGMTKGLSYTGSATRTMARSAYEVYFWGANSSDPYNPNSLDKAATNPSQFYVFNQFGPVLPAALETQLQTVYDNAGVLTALGGARWGFARIYTSLGEEDYVMYSQAHYVDEKTAKEAAIAVNFIKPAELVLTKFSSWVTFKGNDVDFTDNIFTVCEPFGCDKLGGGGGGGGGDVLGPAVAVIDNIAVFADTSGKTIKDSGIPISSVGGGGGSGDVSTPVNFPAINRMILSDSTYTMIWDASATPGAGCGPSYGGLNWVSLHNSTPQVGDYFTVVSGTNSIPGTYRIVSYFSGNTYTLEGNVCSADSFNMAYTVTRSTGTPGKIVTYSNYTMPRAACPTGLVLQSNGTNFVCGAVASGNVSGPASSVANNLATYTDATGKVIKDSAIPVTSVNTSIANFGKPSQVVLAAGTLIDTQGTIAACGPSYGGYNAGALANTLAAAGDIVDITSGGAGIILGKHRVASYLTANTYLFEDDLCTSDIVSFAYTLTRMSGTGSRATTSTNYTIPISVCSNGQILKSDGTNFICATLAAGGTGNVVGPATSEQYGLASYADTTGKLLRNNPYAQVFDGTLYLGNATVANTPGSLVLRNWDGMKGMVSFTNNSNFNSLDIKSPSSLPASYALTLPSAAPADGQSLQSDATGQLSWVTAGGGGGGTGDVVGPASSNDGAPAVFDGATGKLLKDTSGIQFVGSGGIYASGNNPWTLTDGSYQTQIAPGRITMNTSSRTLDIIQNPAQSQNYSLHLPPVAPTVGQVLTAIVNDSGYWDLGWTTPSGGGGGIARSGSTFNNGLMVWDGADADAAKKMEGVAVIGTSNIGLGAMWGGMGPSRGKITFSDQDATNTLTLQPNLNMNAGSWTLTFPEAPPAANQILQAAAGGQLSWINTPSGGGGAVPTCTGSQRVTGNGTTFTCVNNTTAGIGTLDVNWSTSHIFWKGITAPTTLTFSNQSEGMIVVIHIENTSASDTTVTFPTSKWPGGTVINTVKANSTNVYTITRLNSTNFVTTVENIK